MTSWVIGFDLSLTAPAAVALPLDWRPGDWKQARSSLIKPKAPKSDDLRGQLERYKLISGWASSGSTGTVGPVYGCFIEQYAFSRNNAQASKLMELGGIVRVALYERLGVLPMTVSTSSARKLLLGAVPKKDPKIAVQLMLHKAGCPKDWEENICDAFCVANYGLSEVGGVAMTLAVNI